MDRTILVQLLAQRIPAEQFQLWGLDVHWMSEEFDTPENSAIVADVINNFDALSAEYLALQTKEKAVAEIKAKLIEIDIKSIRSLREWIVKQPDAPAFIKTHAEEAVAEREKLIK